MATEVVSAEATELPLFTVVATATEISAVGVALVFGAVAVPVMWPKATVAVVLELKPWQPTSGPDASVTVYVRVSAVVEVAVDASVCTVGAVSTKFDALPPVSEAETIIWLGEMSAVIGFTTIVPDGGAPVSVLQFRVTDVSETVPPAWKEARTLAARNIPDPAVNAISTGTTCRAYCPIAVRRVRNIEVSIVDLPFFIWIVCDSALIQPRSESVAGDLIG